MGGCSSKVDDTNVKTGGLDERRYSTRPSPLTEEDIKSRIECSVKTEIMKGIRGEGGVTYDISYAYLSQRGYYPHALTKANQDAYCSHGEFAQTNVCFALLLFAFSVLAMIDSLIQDNFCFRFQWLTSFELCRCITSVQQDNSHSHSHIPSKLYNFLLHTPQHHFSIASTANFNGEKDVGLWGVFDGHGGAGDHVSHFTKKALPKQLIDEMTSENAKSFNDLNDDVLASISHSAFVKANLACHKAPFDSALSGTTAITVMVKNDQMYINNVGDSRAVVAVRKPDKDAPFKAEHLSIDQTPFRKDERERVKKCGAKVMTIDQIEGLEPIHENWGINLGEEVDESGDPPRVWAQTLDRPGCAFTRSIGDGVAEALGVFAEPEQLQRQIDENTAFIVIASDGVWEFLTSQSVIDMVSQFEGPDAPLEACKAVVAESYRLWLQYEVRTDDITMIVLRIDNFKSPTSSEMESASPNSPSKVSSSVREAHRTSKTTVLTELSGKEGHIQRPVRRTMSKAKRRVIAERTKAMADQNPESFILSEHIVDKTKEESERIEGFIKANFLFQHMSAKQKSNAISCMEKVQCKPGENVITQGEEGDKFYIVESGRYDVSVRDDDGIMNVVLSYNSSGAAFGELSLMYGKPRAATVTAKTDGTLWALNRTAFRGCMMKRNTHTDLIGVLKKVNILKTLSIPQLQRLCDLLAEEEFKAGDSVIKQGEAGHSIYIVEEGELVVTKRNDESGQETEMMKLGVNDYFGERALMYDEARAANVTCVTNCRLLATSRSAFEEVVGSLEQIIAKDQKRREEKKSKLNRASTYVNMHSEKDTIALRGANRSQFSPKHVQFGWGGAFGAFTHKKSGTLNIYSLKIINKQQVKKNQEESSVENERAILATFMKQSSFVPSLLATFQTNGACYMVLKTPIVTDLCSLIDPAKGLSEEVSKFYVACILLALDYMETEGYMIRMVNPPAVMVSSQGYAILSDFRYAKLMTGNRQYTMCGDQSYMAPEMVSKVDWGLGIGDRGSGIGDWGLGIGDRGLLTLFHFLRTFSSIFFYKRLAVVATIFLWIHGRLASYATSA